MTHLDLHRRAVVSEACRADWGQIGGDASLPIALLGAAPWPAPAEVETGSLPREGREGRTPRGGGNDICSRPQEHRSASHLLSEKGDCQEAMWAEQRVCGRPVQG